MKDARGRRTTSGRLRAAPLFLLACSVLGVLACAALNVRFVSRIDAVPGRDSPAMSVAFGEDWTVMRTRCGGGSGARSTWAGGALSSGMHPERRSQCPSPRSLRPSCCCRCVMNSGRRHRERSQRAVGWPSRVWAEWSFAPHHYDAWVRTRQGPIWSGVALSVVVASLCGVVGGSVLWLGRALCVTRWRRSCSLCVRCAYSRKGALARCPLPRVR